MKTCKAILFIFLIFYLSTPINADQLFNYSQSYSESIRHDSLSASAASYCTKSYLLKTSLVTLFAAISPVINTSLPIHPKLTLSTSCNSSCSTIKLHKDSSQPSRDKSFFTADPWTRDFHRHTLYITWHTWRPHPWLLRNLLHWWSQVTIPWFLAECDFVISRLPVYLYRAQSRWSTSYTGWAGCHFERHC